MSLPRQPRETEFSQKLPRLKLLRTSEVGRVPQNLLFFLKTPLSKAFVKIWKERNKYVHTFRGGICEYLSHPQIFYKNVVLIYYEVYLCNIIFLTNVLSFAPCLPNRRKLRITPEPISGLPCHNPYSLNLQRCERGVLLSCLLDFDLLIQKRSPQL